jgi:hypothetical protein
VIDVISYNILQRPIIRVNAAGIEPLSLSSVASFEEYFKVHESKPRLGAKPELVFVHHLLLSHISKNTAVYVPTFSGAIHSSARRCMLYYERAPRCGPQSIYLGYFLLPGHTGLLLSVSFLLHILTINAVGQLALPNPCDYAPFLTASNACLMRKDLLSLFHASAFGIDVDVCLNLCFPRFPRRVLVNLVSTIG